MTIECRVAPDFSKITKGAKKMLETPEIEY